MRSKEEAHDYRYFPEPDLVTVYVDEKWKQSVLRNLPEFPEARMKRFIEQYSIPEYDAEVLTQDKSVADYFEKVCASLKSNHYKAASNWMMTEVMRILNQDKIEIIEFWVSEENVSSLIKLIDDGIISNNIAKEVFVEMLKYKDPDSEAQKPEVIVKEKNLLQLSDSSEIEELVKKILADYPNELKRYKNGETKLAGFFVGKIMKESKGRANPQKVNELLNNILG
jgi:aspartyl-tRNA(Asn)/glutamyl-tRNA(Gln) amidotransferase subunit B